MKQGTRTALAHAKVNLGLAVIARRGDGYHELETVMAKLQLADELTVTTGSSELHGGHGEVTLKLSGEQAVGLTPGPDNLVVRAVNAYLAAFPGQQPSVTVTLRKSVPVAAGLGGGSSNAATVLRLMQQADADSQPAGRPRVSEEELLEMGLTLGSDVPFFLSGAPAAVARGRGERLRELTLPPLHLVLVNLGLKLSSADAYGSLMGFTPRLKPERILALLTKGLDPLWPNALQPGVLREHRDVRTVLGVLREAGLKGVLMSGSGPTCFGMAPTEAEAQGVAARIAADHPEWWVRVSSTLSDAA